jgi:2-polyprenyl-6-methoxyphenol hydroxylase-like FAD-dependent oxidoreductase
MRAGHCDVLIVGAGPTGLTLASLLARSGIAFRIIDASPRPQTGSRGKALHPRSLELFDDLGIAQRVIANGAFGVPVRFCDATGKYHVQGMYETQPSRPDAPYLLPLLTPQWRVEEALRAKLDELGGRVEFGTELTGFSQDADGVTAQVAGPEGAAEIRTRWLVGCDGGRSTLRQQAGIAFLGETLETHRVLVGDVRATGLDRDHWHVWQSAEGIVALCPLPSTDTFQFQASIAPDQEIEPTLETCRNLTRQRSQRDDIMLSDAGWLSLWRANVRMVDRYRVGNVFLAGDAAHVHSPAGGQGMNTGIQDAYNLSWKFAAVIGGADAALLDTYQEERLPIAAWVLGVSNKIMATAMRTIDFQRDEETLQLGLDYCASSLAQDMRRDGQGLRAGDRAPQAPRLTGPQGSCSMFDLLRGPHATLLGFGAQWRRLIQTCEAQFAGALKGYVLIDKPGDPRDTIDADGHARAAYRDGTLFVVRPDNYIGLATEKPDIEPVIAYLAKILPAR